MHFQLLSAVAVPSVLEMWEPETEAVSFSAPGEEAEAVWSVDVSATPEVALEQLNSGLGRMAQTEAALLTAQARLETLVEKSQSAVSFAAPKGAAPEATALPPAEQDLLTKLEVLQGGPVSFSAAAPDLADDREDLTQSLERLIQSITYFAFVETRVEGRLLCRTTLNWAADAGTLGDAGLTGEQWALHQKTLALAVQSRTALMKTVALAAQSALKISAALALPGGALLALPAAWKFFKHVLSELEAKPV